MNGETIALPGNSMLDVFVGLLMGHFVRESCKKAGAER
jgi:hypothetical protein